MITAAAPECFYIDDVTVKSRYKSSAGWPQRDEMKWWFFDAHKWTTRAPWASHHGSIRQSPLAQLRENSKRKTKPVHIFTFVDLCHPLSRGEERNNFYGLNAIIAHNEQPFLRRPPFLHFGAPCSVPFAASSIDDINIMCLCPCTIFIT